MDRTALGDRSRYREEKKRKNAHKVAHRRWVSCSLGQRGTMRAAILVF